MRRPAAAAVIALALVAAACGGGGRETPPFSVPTSVVGQVTFPDIGGGPVCRLAMGTGLGVEVVSVEPDMPVSALLQVGDVITHVDGVGVAESGDFRTLMSKKDFQLMRRFSFQRIALLHLFVLWPLETWA